MKAVIMAGGEGTRLRPMTSLLPKPMVPIVNQPVMEHILGLVKHHGITEAVATLAFMPHVITDYFGDGDEWGMSLEYAVEETPLGTAGSVKNAQDLLPDDEPFIVISGDSITDIDLTALLAFHRERGGAVTIALKAVEDPLDFGVVITAEDGRIERFLEKPTWGQVFSDRINTGIYVIEPWVLDKIPPGTPYDFSSELFPALMDEGHALYGSVTECYWCDVGSRDSYLDVHRDILDGKAMIYVPGVHARPGLWVSDSARVDPSARIGDKVVIGDNVTIRADAVVGDHVVVGDNCVISTGARVDHSVMWSDTFVGMHASVTGSVLCRRVDVRARAVLDSGVTIGSEAVVGKGSHVAANVQVFPYKRIEPAAMVTSSLIWESTGQRALFSEKGLQGLVGIDITAEVALKIAEAFGSLLPKGGHVVVTRDTSRASRMIKRAMVSGLNAAGINVRDLRVASPAVSRFTTQKTRCVGGVHISASPNGSQSLHIDFFDKNGLDLAPWDQKKIERLYFRGEFRRAFFDEVGEIIYPPRPLEYYAAAVHDAVRGISDDGRWLKVVCDMACGAASLTLPILAHDWHVNLVALNPVLDTESNSGCGLPDAESLALLSGSAELFGADFSVAFDRDAERVHLLTRGRILLDGDTTLHALVDLWGRSRAGAGGAIAVPLTASRVVEEVAGRHGLAVIRPGTTGRSLAQAVIDGRVGFAGDWDGRFIFGDEIPAFDGVLTVGMVARLLAAADVSLDDVVRELPQFAKAQVAVFCPAGRKGAVMRAVTEASERFEADLTEGVRVEYPDGWALVLPDSTEPLVSVWAEGSDRAEAEARAGYWKAIVEETVGTA